MHDLEVYAQPSPCLAGQLTSCNARSYVNLASLSRTVGDLRRAAEFASRGNRGRTAVREPPARERGSRAECVGDDYLRGDWDAAIAGPGSSSGDSSGAEYMDVWAWLVIAATAAARGRSAWRARFASPGHSSSARRAIGDPQVLWGHSGYLCQPRIRGRRRRTPQGCSSTNSQRRSLDPSHSRSRSR